MYINLPEGTYRNPEDIIKYANRTRINMMKNAISFLKSFKGVRYKFNNKGSALSNRYKAIHSLTYIIYEPMPEQKKVWCDAEKISQEDMFIIEYISYYLR